MMDGLVLLISFFNCNASLSMIETTSWVLLIGEPSGSSNAIDISSPSSIGKNVHFTQPPATNENDIMYE